MDHSVTVAAAGDLQLGDSPICVGFGFASRLADGLDRAFAEAGSLVAGADVVFGNLETTLSARGLDPQSWRSRQMRGRPAFAASLRRAAFTVLNTANNHAVQHGDGAFADTVSLLAKSGVAACGQRGRTPWCAEPILLDTKSGSRVGVLGYCLRPRQHGGDVPPYAEGTREEILNDVHRLRQEADCVLVSLHWGEEFVNRPSMSEVGLGRAIVDAGASLVLGHHPHVIRPAERYRHGVIAYSLGNFLGDMIWQAPLRRGALLRARLAGDRVEEAQLLPVWIGTDYVPRPAGPNERLLEEGELAGLDEPAYSAAVQHTLRSQRLAAYGYALRNVGRYPPRMLFQLGAATIRNKLGRIS